MGTFLRHYNRLQEGKSHGTAPAARPSTEAILQTHPFTFLSLGFHAQRALAKTFHPVWARVVRDAGPDPLIIGTCSAPRISQRSGCLSGWGAPCASSRHLNTSAKLAAHGADSHWKTLMHARPPIAIILLCISSLLPRPGPASQMPGRRAWRRHQTCGTTSGIQAGHHSSLLRKP